MSQGTIYLLLSVLINVVSVVWVVCADPWKLDSDLLRQDWHVDQE